MMHKLKIYLDTSIISFLFADDSPDFRNVTESFFRFHAPRYELFISDVVRLEINKDPDLEHRQKLLGVLQSYPIQDLSMERREEVMLLAQLYIARGAIPKAKIEDALHVAFAVVYDMDVLLSWNFKHLANINKEARLVAVSMDAGYRHALRLTSPLEVVDETD
jgi:predicted nucleic acid-binding protein